MGDMTCLFSKITLAARVEDRSLGQSGSGRALGTLRWLRVGCPGEWAT